MPKEVSAKESMMEQQTLSSIIFLVLILISIVQIFVCLWVLQLASGFP